MRWLSFVACCVSLCGVCLSSVFAVCCLWLVLLGGVLFVVCYVLVVGLLLLLSVVV